MNRQLYGRQLRDAMYALKGPEAGVLHAFLIRNSRVQPVQVEELC